MRENFSHLVFLIQTDTTVGLLSKSADRLSQIKRRDKNKPFLKSISSFKELKQMVRVDKKYRKTVRRKKKTTFIYPNKEAFRVVFNYPHRDFLKRYGWFYSTSANKSSNSFDFDYIKDKVDIIVYTPDDFEEKSSSFVYMLGKSKIRRIR